MQFNPQAKPPVGVVFDSDMGSDIDAALALMLLYGFDGKNECRVISLSVTRNSLQAAAFCEAVAQVYAGPPNPFFSRIPVIGMATNGASAGDPPMLASVLARKKPDGSPLFATGIHELVDTADPAPAIRNALTAQHDGNAMVVLAGPATNLVRTMELRGVRDLIAAKVRYLAFAATPAHIQTDMAAAKKLLQEWPTPVFAVMPETGQAVKFPADTVEKGLDWTPNHPVMEAYRAYKPMPYDSPTADMATVLYAIRPKEGYFKVSDPGMLSVRDDGSVQWAAAPDGKQYQVTSDEGQSERILKTYLEVAMAKPVVRQRFRPKKAEDDKDEKKPEEKKLEPKTPLA